MWPAAASALPTASARMAGPGELLPDHVLRDDRHPHLGSLGSPVPCPSCPRTTAPRPAPDEGAPVKVLVTGSAGLIGSEAVEYFDRLGFDVHGVDNNMRADFFGPGGDTTWNRQRLEATCARYTHHDTRHPRPRRRRRRCSARAATSW